MRPCSRADGTLDFKLTTTPDGGMAQFYYRQPQGEWQSIGPACPTDILTDEHCRGFTGAHVGCMPTIWQGCITMPILII